MAVRLITGSLGYKPKSVVQNREQRLFSENTEDTPLKPASATQFHILIKVRMTRLEILKLPRLANFFSLWPIFDLQTHTHHRHYGHSTAKVAALAAFN